MLNMFRIVSLVEGLSFLVLLLIAMPLKYHYGMPEAVSIAGRTHGMLFIAFVALAFVNGPRQGWSDKFQAQVILAGMVPLGCFWLERRLKREAMEPALQNG